MLIKSNLSSVCGVAEVFKARYWRMPTPRFKNFRAMHPSAEIAFKSNLSSVCGVAEVFKARYWRMPTPRFKNFRALHPSAEIAFNASVVCI